MCKLDAKKACGLDGLPGRLLKEATVFIAKPLANLFNKSLLTGSLPRDWKAATVTPIHKEGSRHQPGNYRPVSLTSLVVKIMERVITRKLRAFVDEHGID